MRHANGYGSICKLKGNRRKPWMVRITTGWDLDENGMKVKQIQKVLGYYAKREEAIKALADYNDAPFDLSGLSVTFNDIWERVVVRDLPESSARNYIGAYKYLEPIYNIPIKSIKADQMQRCIDSCTTTQQNLIKSCCRKVFDHALKYDLVSKNPSHMLKAIIKDAEIVREVFTHEEVEELWTINTWWSKLTLILLFTGMRGKELRTIELEMIDFDNAWLDIEFAKNKYSVRGLPIHEKIIPLLRDYMINGGNYYGYAHSSLNKYLRKFHGHKAHDCRHSFTTRMRELGVDHLVVQRLLGHRPSDITYEVYTHLTREELRDAIGKLDY